MNMRDLWSVLSIVQFVVLVLIDTSIRPVRCGDFCGHSVSRSDLIRVKRSHHRRAGRQSGHQEFPRQQQENQLLIDETDQTRTFNSQSRVDNNAPSRRACPPHDTSRGSSPRLGSSSNDLSDSDATNCNNHKVIETAVFIDQALDNKFNGLSGGLNELNKLVLTIMNQVQQIFKYSSLKVPITIKLVLVEHMKDLDQRAMGLALPSPERGDIDAYLSNFCVWQQSRLDREKRIWWDHAILLSGLDLYKASPSKNHTGVLGLAWVGGMCRSNYSCTVNEASNFESAFVIAHEIGHSLGIMHDGQRNGCDPNTFIMSERTGAGKVHWSRCSNNYLNESVHRQQLSCLINERTQTNDPMYDLSKLRSPGQVFSINDQCKLAFGANYTSFVTRQPPFNSVCKELWCVSGSWAKAAHPALEGSSCGEPDLTCREGKCTR